MSGSVNEKLLLTARKEGIEEQGHFPNGRIIIDLFVSEAKAVLQNVIPLKTSFGD